MAKGQTQQFKATGIYSDGSSIDLTATAAWTSDNGAAVTINGSTGLAQTVGVGSATITAASGAASGHATLNVTAAVLQSLAVTPAIVRVGVDISRQMTATGIYTDGSTVDLTASSTWTSSQAEVAAVSSSGLVSAAALGETTVSATDGALTGSATFSVVIPKFAYVANAVSNTVSVYTINPTNGVLTAGSAVPAGAGPASVTIDPTGRFAYVPNALANTVSEYTVNPNTGNLAPVGAPVATTTYPTSVVVDPTGTFAYVVCKFFSFPPGPSNPQIIDNIEVFTINQSTGALVEVSTMYAASPDTFVIDPSGRFGYESYSQQISDIAYSHLIAEYPIDRATGALGSGTVAALPGNFGVPGGMAVDPMGRFVIVIDPYNNDVTTFAIDQTSGALTAVGTSIPTGTAPIAVVVEPTGRFVYVSNGTSNDVWTYSINQATGALSQVGAPIAAGTSPMAAAVDPTGQFLYVSNQGASGADGSVSVYGINQTTGTLTAVGTPAAAGMSAAGITVF